MLLTRMISPDGTTTCSRWLKMVLIHHEFVGPFLEDSVKSRVVWPCLSNFKPLYVDLAHDFRIRNAEYEPEDPMKQETYRCVKNLVNGR